MSYVDEVYELVVAKNPAPPDETQAARDSWQLPAQKPHQHMTL